jgi:hypothetical protein
MEVTESTVKKLCIKKADELDNIAVYLEDFDIGQGKIVIECYGKSWSSCWFAMGNKTMAEFFKTADVEYLAGKLAPEIERMILDESEEALAKTMKAHIIEMRKKGEMNKKDAKYFWTDIERYMNGDGINNNQSLLSRVFDTELFHDQLFTIENPHYVYLAKIIQAVKDGLSNVK